MPFLASRRASILDKRSSSFHEKSSVWQPFLPFLTSILLSVLTIKKSKQKRPRKILPTHVETCTPLKTQLARLYERPFSCSFCGTCFQARCSIDLYVYLTSSLALQRFGSHSCFLRIQQTIVYLTRSLPWGRLE